MALSPRMALFNPGPQTFGEISLKGLADFECESRGGILAFQPSPAGGGVRCIVPGGTNMGLRAELIAGPGFSNMPVFSGSFPTEPTSLLGNLIQGGFGALNQFIASKFGGPGVASPTPVPLASVQAGGLIPSGGPGGLVATGAPGLGIAVVTGAIVAAGGAIVGTVIRITRAGWAKIPALIKQAAVALGLTVAFTDIGVAGLPGFGGAAVGELSQAQQNKIARFQQMTGAGVPPGIAARATGIGRKRRRGISAFELSGFRKISHLLSHVGMVPRGLRGARARAHHHHKG